MKSECGRAFAMASVIVWATSSHAASVTLDVSLNTTPLIAGTTAPYYVEFQLNDGDGIANTSFLISSFAFGGGAAAGSPSLVGGASGDTSTGITINDSSFFNEFYQEFQPGSSLSFSVRFDSPMTDPVIPDRFTFAILNSSLFEIPTSGAGNELLGFDLRNPLQFEVYTGASGTTDPVLTAPAVSIVPIPPALLLFTSGITGLLLLFRRRHVGAA